MYASHCIVELLTRIMHIRSWNQ